MIKYITGIVAVVLLMYSYTSTTYAAEYTDAEAYGDLLMTTTRNDVQGIYNDMRRDTLSFSNDMVSREMEERFGTKVPSYGVSIDEQGFPIVRTWAEQFFTEQRQRDFYTRSLKRYLEFTDVYLMAKYGGMFANGSTEDGTIDIYVDAEELQREIIGEDMVKESRVNYGGFSRGMTSYAARVTGQSVPQSYIAASGADSADYDFSQGETYFGVCTIQSSQEYSEQEKQAVIGSLNAVEVVQDSSSNPTVEELLPIEGDSTIDRIILGESIDEQACIPDPSGRPSDMCITFQLKQQQPRLTRTAKVLSLEDATNALHETLGELARQDLTARADSSTSFTLPWFDLKLRPSFQLQIRSIPVFASRRFSEVFQVNTLTGLHNDWNSLLRGERPISSLGGTVEENQTASFSVSKSSLTAAQIEGNLEVYKTTLPIRTRMETEKRFVDIYGGSLESLSAMISSLSTSTQTIKKEAHALATKLLE